MRVWPAFEPTGDIYLLYLLKRTSLKKVGSLYLVTMMLQWIHNFLVVSSVIARLQNGNC